MKVSQLKRFLMTCSPNMDIGISLMTKGGAQFCNIEGNGMSVFKTSDGCKCLSLFEARKNDPFPEGAIVEGIDMLFDDIPTDPDAILAELNARFNITPQVAGKKPEELSDDELTDVMFECIHKEIGDLIRLNNNLLVYVKNKYKKQKKYWITVTPREVQENAKL